MKIETNSKEAAAVAAVDSHKEDADELEALLSQDVSADFKSRADTIRLQIHANPALFDQEEQYEGSYGANTLLALYVPAQNPDGFVGSVNMIGVTNESITELADLMAQGRNFALGKAGKLEDAEPNAENAAKSICAMVLREAITEDMETWAKAYPRLLKRYKDTFRAHVVNAVEVKAGYLPGQKIHTVGKRRSSFKSKGQYEALNLADAAAKAARTFG